MPDDTDIATAIEERDREAALAAHRAEQQRQALRNASMQTNDPTAPVNCLGCGDEVPKQRLEAHPNTRRCTQCASDLEARNRLK